MLPPRSSSTASNRPAPAGSLDARNFATIDSSYQAGPVTVYVISGMPLLPKNV